MQAADEAVANGGSLAEAHYQRGLALAAKQDMAGAAAALEKATELDPRWAYAHYYAGIAYSKVKRVDLGVALRPSSSSPQAPGAVKCSRS